MLTCNTFIDYNKDSIGILLCNDKYVVTSKDPNIKNLSIEGYEEFIETGILQQIKIKIIYPKVESSLVTVEYIAEGRGFVNFFSKPKYKWVCTIKDTNGNILIDKTDLNMIYLDEIEDKRKNIQELLKCIGINHVHVERTLKTHIELKNVKQQTLEVTM